MALETPDHAQEPDMTNGVQECSSRFLRLPREIRDQVYSYHFLDSERDASLTLSEARSQLAQSVSYLRSCKQIYDECLPILYGQVTFFFDDIPLDRPERHHHIDTTWPRDSQGRYIFDRPQLHHTWLNDKNNLDCEPDKPCTPLIVVSPCGLYGLRYWLRDIGQRSRIHIRNIHFHCPQDSLLPEHRQYYRVKKSRTDELINTSCGIVLGEALEFLSANTFRRMIITLADMKASYYLPQYEQDYWFHVMRLRTQFCMMFWESEHLYTNLKGLAGFEELVVGVMASPDTETQMRIKRLPGQVLVSDDRGMDLHMQRAMDSFERLFLPMQRKIE